MACETEDSAVRSVLLLFGPNFEPPIIDLPSTSNDSSNSSHRFPEMKDDPVVVVVYEVLIPLIASVGILGNAASYGILGMERFSRSLMYVYMRGLAVTDLIYLIFSLQACYLISSGYFIATDQRNPESRFAATYVWNLFSPLWNTFASSSDLIIVCMTIDRYRVMRTIDQLQRCQVLHKKTSNWSVSKYVYLQIWGSVFVSFFFHIPYFFQYETCPCNNGNITCYYPESTEFSTGEFFKAFGYVYIVLLKMFPSLIITALNTLMLVKLRQVWKQRKQLRENLRNEKLRKECGLGSVTTISQLLFRPPEINGQESSSDGIDRSALSRIKARISRPKKPRRKRIFLLPGKASRKELRMTSLLVSVVVCNVLLTMPGNATYFLWTVFPEYWEEIPYRTEFSAVADLLYTINYSINFYLYCAANKEIRVAAEEMWRCGKCKKKEK